MRGALRPVEGRAGAGCRRTARSPVAPCHPLASRLSRARVAAGCGPSGGHRALSSSRRASWRRGPGLRRAVPAPVLFPARRSAASTRLLAASRSERRGDGGSGGGDGWALAWGPVPTSRADAGHLPGRGSRGLRNPRSRLLLSHRAGQAPWLADSEPGGARLTVMVPDGCSPGSPSPVRAPPAGAHPDETGWQLIPT